ncbi:conserved Plasmodium protein, unknown function [Plasmodium ovale]|uniref:Uncharacterized protein n=1 Tax=Plasmodium ovale TaxID=36330 RepID=A0A1D3U8V3_PLAOA|nr:conserved Plasmodium protein, unknown function [Plasmodium ovale]
MRGRSQAVPDATDATDASSEANEEGNASDVASTPSTHSTPSNGATSTTSDTVWRRERIDEFYIQKQIDKLNVEELIQPEQNRALKKVIRTDRKIALLLDNKISKLHKSCQYGKHVSKIIKFKAEGLSTSSLKEKLKLILETFAEAFSDGPRVDRNGDYREDGIGIQGSRLNFSKISDHFGTKTFSFCPLNYDTIPLHFFLTDENIFAVERKERKAYIRSNHTNISYKKLNEYEQENELEIKLETYEESMKLKHKLNKLEEYKKNIPFINFIIDCDPLNGFNKTTFHLFLITLLVSKGHIEFYRDVNNVLCIKTCTIMEENEPSNPDSETHEYQGTKTRKKNQALLTSWSYCVWERLASQLTGDSLAAKRC